MNGLLYKDWRIISKTKALYFGLLYFLFIIPSTQGNILSGDVYTNFFMIFIVYLIFSYLISYDYKYNGLSFVSAFPITKKNIVTARYIFIMLVFLACLLIYFTILIAESIISNKAFNLFNILSFEKTGFLFLIFGLYFSISLPLYYKYGYQKIKWMVFLSLIICNIIISIVKTSIQDLNQPFFMIIAAIFSLFLYRLSLNISVKNFMKSSM